MAGLDGGDSPNLIFNKAEGTHCNNHDDLAYEGIFGGACQEGQVLNIANGVISTLTPPAGAKGATLIMEPNSSTASGSVLARLKVCGANPSPVEGFPLYQFAVIKIGKASNLANVKIIGTNAVTSKVRVFYDNGSIDVQSFGERENPGGALTDTQLRNAPVPVNTGFNQPVTDAELRAAPVPVDTGLAQPITDAELRAAPIPVEVDIAQPLTNAELRAVAVPVATGLNQPVTDAQLRASSVQIKLEGNTANIPALSIQPHASVGVGSHHRRNSTADTNLTSVKGGVGTIAGIEICNDSAGKIYFKLYNKATAPVIAADAALLVKVYVVPAGANLCVPVPTAGYRLATGIAYAITGALADTDASAVQTGVVVNISYT